MKFSVLIPTRNRLELLKYALESVVRQHYDDWEVIVADNQSEDNVAAHVKGMNEPRIKYFRTARFLPVTDNWNFALAQASGDFVIMLGDDDCLLQGYFTELAELIERFDAPDFIYTDAFQYAYPDVIPGHAKGFLQIGHAKFFGKSTEPFLLPRSEAMDAVMKSLQFRVTFGYNMQYFLVSRKLIERLKNAGPFFQSPYPDYYASNVLFLKAERILIVPRPLVTIGISRKSFGYFYFNGREAEGVSFLNNTLPDGVPQHLASTVLPGSEMNTSWLIAMDRLKKNFSSEAHFPLGTSRYRLLQLTYTWQHSGIKGMARLVHRMSLGELGLMPLLAAAAAFARIAPAGLRRRVLNWLSDNIGAYPRFDPRIKTVDYKNILEVFENEKPNYYAASASE